MNADAPTPPAPDAEPGSMPPAAPQADAPPAADALTTPPAAPAKPATWPQWFPAFDTALAIFAVVLAFLMASFVARNSDLWRHLAAGRLVTQFQYPVGGDPFSFTAENRVWVNAHWLGETVLYLLYAADPSGAVVVAAKAVAFAAAFGLLFLLRKPGFPLWPWAVAAAAAVVAAGGQTHLRPQVLGLPLLAGILAVLFTGNWAKGSKWKMPAVLGGLTAVWANVDTFAFLSPLLVGLIWLGEWLHPRLLPSADDPPADDPFPTPPPRPALLRALLLCAAACLLNPTFLAGLVKDPGEAVAQLVPFELDWQAAEDLRGDRDLSRSTFSVFHQGPPRGGQSASEMTGGGYLDNPAYGKNASGITAVVLWGVGLLAAGGVLVLGVLRRAGVVGWSFGRLGWVLVWLAFTLLAALVHARFVPYAAVVGVPLLAAALTALGRRVPPLERLSAEGGRGVVMLTALGRVLSLLAVVLAILAALPGWLHPRSSVPGMQRYVAWAVKPDEGMERAGRMFARWHADPVRGPALAGTRGLNTHPDLGDYLAYFAPAEKSFVTSRFRLHRTELADLVAVREVLLAVWASASEPPVQAGRLTPLLDKYQVDHLNIAQAFVLFPPRTVLNAQIAMSDAADPAMTLTDTLWQVDGRLGVVGRKDTPAGAERTRAMGWEAAAFAFGRPPAAPTPPPLAAGERPQEGWEYDLLFIRPPLPPVDLDDASTYNLYADLVPQESNARASLLTQWWAGGTGLVGGGPLFTLATLEGGQQREVRFGPLPEFPRQDKEFALPFLIARSARRGLVDDPNNADGYLTLARAFQKPLMPDTEPPREVFRVPLGSPLAPTEGEVQVLTALTRAVARLPEPGPTADRYTPRSLQVRADLLQTYLRVGPLVATPVIGTPTRIGFLDSAQRVARELAALAAAARPSDPELARAFDRTVDSLPIRPLWGAVFNLCQQDFWFEFQQFAAAGRVPGTWEQRLQRREIFELMVERKYLKAEDDPRKWVEKFVQAQQAGEDVNDTVRQRLVRLADVLDELVRRRADRVSQATRGGPPDDAFLGYVQAGLPDAALKMVLHKEGEVKQEVAVQAADVLRLLLWVGQAEDAQRLFDQEVAKGSADSPSLPRDRRALLKAKFRVIEYELAKLNGDYARADALFQEVLATPVSDLGAGRPADSLMFGDQWLPAIYKPLTDAEKTLLLAGSDLLVAGAVVGGWPAEAFANAFLTTLRDRLLYQAFTRYQRGVYALLAGDVARAKEHFDAAVVPQGTPLEKVGLPPQLYPPLGLLLPKYRELLARYAEKK